LLLSLLLLPLLSLPLLLLLLLVVWLLERLPAACRRSARAGASAGAQAVAAEAAWSKLATPTVHAAAAARAAESWARNASIKSPTWSRGGKHSCSPRVRTT
jgi:hypothetical protein